MSRLGERWKQTVIVDNKAGASGIVGSEIVAKSPPDGYTLLVTTSAHTINPFFTKHMPYDTERDFTPITVLVIGALALAGSTRSGFDSIQKFLAAARAEPGKYQFGSADSTTRMIGELFRVKSGLDIENVAYKGAAPMIQELAGGHIPVGFSSPLSVMAHHRAGTVHILAVTSEKRLVLPLRAGQHAAGPGAAHPRRRRGGTRRSRYPDQDPRSCQRARRGDAGGLRPTRQERPRDLARYGESRRHRARMNPRSYPIILDAFSF
jgi:hypothetical protein